MAKHPQSPVQRVKIIELQNSLIRSAQLPTCTNCDHWRTEKQLCDKYNVLPPAEIIVTGCEIWIDGIPF